jgi:WD40 repeat protein
MLLRGWQVSLMGSFNYCNFFVALFKKLFFNTSDSNFHHYNFNRYLITCGQDGDIRIWDGIEDSDPIEKCVGSEVFAIHQIVILINYVFYD